MVVELLGRDGDLRRLWSLLEDCSVLLTGPRRIGKTAVLKEMVRLPPPGWRPVRVDVQGLRTTEAGLAAIRSALPGSESVAAEVRRQVGRVSKVDVVGVGLERASAPRDTWEVLRSELDRVARSPARPVLLIDELPWWVEAIHRVEGAGAARATLARLRRLREDEGLSGGLRMVLTGSIGLGPVTRGLDAAEELNDLERMELPPLPRVHGEALFEASVSGRGGSCGPAAAAEAYTMAGGSPHWIKMLANRVPGGDADGPGAVQSAVEALLKPRLADLFDDQGRAHLERRHPDHVNAVRAALSVVAATADPTPLSAVLSAAMKAQPGLGRADARRLALDLVAAFLLEAEDDGLAFRNPLFRLWWLRYGG